MLTRAKVIRSADNNKGCKWWVNIPILNGIPDSEEEGEDQRDLYNAKVLINSLLKEEDQKSNAAIVKETYEDWDTRKIKFNGKNNDGSKSDSWDLKGQKEEFLTEASVCIVNGMSNTISVGDIVIVGFEDNDMGKPIILGHLLTESLTNRKDSFPNLKLQSLKVEGKSDLSTDTNIEIAGVIKNWDLTTENIKELWDFYQSFAEAFGMDSNGNPISCITSLSNIINSLKVLLPGGGLI